MQNQFSEIRLERVTSCISCGASKFQPVDKYIFEDFKLGYFYCEQCGLVQMNPRPTESSMLEFYNRQYWDTFLSHDMMIRKQKKRARAISSNLVPFLGEISSEKVQVLEIGSSWGVTLKKIGADFKENGKDAILSAIEPNVNSTVEDHGIFNDIKLIGRDYHDLAKTDKTFDLIILSHVLEHLYDPRRALELISQRLSPGGLFYVEVPNFYGHASYSIYHLTCFTRQTLKAMLLQAGFSRLDLLYYGGDQRFPKFLGYVCRKDGTGEIGPRSQVESFTEVIGKRHRAEKFIRRSKFLNYRKYTDWVYRKLIRLWSSK